MFSLTAFPIIGPISLGFCMHTIFLVSLKENGVALVGYEYVKKDPFLVKVSLITVLHNQILCELCI